MSMDHALRPERRLSGYHVLAGFVGFFLIVFAMNAVMIYQAVTTFGGLETTDAYRKGLAYNERIADEEAQARLGWTAKVAVNSGHDGIVLHMTGSDAKPVTGLSVTGTLGRAATSKFDRTITLTEAEPGVYSLGGGERLEAGTWVVDLRATRMAADGGGERIDIRRRLWVTP